MKLRIADNKIDTEENRHEKTILKTLSEEQKRKYLIASIQEKFK